MNHPQMISHGSRCFSCIWSSMVKTNETNRSPKPTNLVPRTLVVTRGDIVEAYFLFFTLTHEGQGSRKYARLSKLLTYFKPAPALTYETCDEDTRKAVDTLIARETA